MRVLINTTNLKVGGGLQVSYSILHEFKGIAEHEYHVLLSPQVEQLIATETFGENFHFYRFSANPTTSTSDLLKHRQGLYDIEKKVKPDFVLTVFGPALWKPYAPHMIGFANGYFLFHKSRFVQRVLLKSIFRRILYYVRRKVLFSQLKAEGNVFWVETPLAQRELSKTLRIPQEQIYVIPNTYGSQYENTPIEKPQNEVFTFLYLAAHYPQKNLILFNKLIPLLKKRNINCRFLLTLKEENYNKLFTEETIKEKLINLGPVKPETAPDIYNKADALFFPSLLETFSANYPEAMKMERPILTSDLPFAHDVCGDAAVYFDPYNAEDAADKIEQLIKDKALQQKLIENGLKRLTIFGNAANRANRLLEVMQKHI